jgi:hypothetical protein
MSSLESVSSVECMDTWPNIAGISNISLFLIWVGIFDLCFLFVWSVNNQR